MNVSLIKITLTIALLSWPVVAFSASKNSVLNECRAAMASGDISAAQDSATTIFTWRNLFSDELKIDGARCLTFARQSQHVYDANQGLFVTGAAIEGALDVETARDLLNQLTDAKAILDKTMIEVGAINDALIENEVHSTCSSEYLHNPQAIILNPECVRAFRKLGHPMLDEAVRDDGAYLEAKGRYNRLFEQTMGLRD